MRVIDLSTSLYTGMEVFEGDPEVKIEIVHRHEKNTWELRSIEMGSHTGTHVDAPSHMHKGSETLDEIDVERFFGRSQVLSLNSLDILDVEFPKNIGLFFIEDIGVEYLEKILDSSPKFVGGDISEDLERSLLGRGIITYTGLVNLQLIPRDEEFMFYGLPLKIKSGDGSPVRAIAVLED